MQSFVVDQAQTFSGMAALESTPKTQFESDEQDTTKDGVPKWTVQLIAGFTDQFGKSQNEILNVTVASKDDPLKNVGQFTPVHLKGFQVGVMDRRDRQGNVLGAQVYFRAEAVEPAEPASTSNGSRQSSKESVA